MANLLAPQFTDADKARKHLERVRWPEGPICPHCGLLGEAYRLKPTAKGKSHVRKGLWKCAGCRKEFSVTIGTIFEDSHIPLNVWLLAIHLLCSSKKGMSAHQLHRMLGITYKSAWFMAHRIRHGMEDSPSGKLKGTVEVDETYVGGKEPGIGRGNYRGVNSKKTPVVALVERQGKVRSFPVGRVTLENISPLLKKHVEMRAHLNTDDSKVYDHLKPWFPFHESVTHSKGEYVRREQFRDVHTNTVEGFFSLVKRGVYGTYHHWGKQHLHRYLAEFDFRYNARKVTDEARALAALKGFEGKRLMYK